MSNVDNVIECAIEYAENRQHEYVTVEHLMLCLLENEEIIEIVDNITADREVAIND
jgi:ATP-dependent Clp protease ATP-binding subunit ClpA